MILIILIITNTTLLLSLIADRKFHFDFFNYVIINKEFLELGSVKSKLYRAKIFI